MLEYYQQKDKASYFQRVKDTLGARRAGERYVVLLDPDTGLAGDKPTRAYLCWDDLSSVWEAMETGDTLLIYQHNARKKKVAWIEDLTKKIADRIGRIREEVDCQPRSDVCFFSIRK